MQTTYESKQAVEITAGDGYNETVFSIGLKCTASSYAGCYDPSVAGEPPSGPEFEVTTIQVLSDAVKYEVGSNAKFSVLDLTPAEFETLLGAEISHYLYDRAMEEATESGDF